METQDYLLLVTAMSCLSVFLPFFYPTCALGENVTAAFAGMNESIYEISWYACPVDFQKYLIPMILMAEKPFRIHVFGSLDCSRDTFKHVINTGYSGFMMLRRLN